jgi:hypothetical protein
MENPLIIVRLLGGLGNQMFQYALGRQLSLIHKRPLKLDISYYTEATPDPKKGIRIYCLNHFNIQAEIATLSDIKPFQKYLGKQNFFSKVLRHASGLGKYYRRSYIFEPPKNYLVFDPKLLRESLKPVVYLDGFWQTEKYFSGIEKIIRQDFSFTDAADEINQTMLAEIDSCDSVAIHIRHGDNATKVAAKHGVLPLEYYHQAVNGLIKTVAQPHFYIFSDDPEWAKENLKLNFPATFVTHNGDEKNYEDLRLMTYCKHHIIGNSTFSWWGAWLGKKSGQLVYAPKKYHVKDNIPTTDLYPGGWELIEV